MGNPPRSLGASASPVYPAPVTGFIGAATRKKTNSRRTIAIAILQRHKPTANLKALAKVLTNRVDTVLE